MPEDGGILTRVSRNTAILTIAQVIEKAINFFLVVLLMRYLQKDLFGQYSFASSYVLLFNVMVGLGFAALCTREMSRRMDEAPRILSAALVPMVFSSLFAMVTIGISIFLSKPGQPVIVVAVLILTVDMIANNIASIFDSVARAHEHMLYSALPTVSRSAVLLVLYLVLLPYGMGLVEVCALVLCSSVVRLLMHVMFCHKVFHVAPAPEFDRALAKRLLVQSYPMALISAFIIIYYKIDAVMLSYMRTNAEVGLYSAASTLAFAMVFLAGNFQQAVYPAMAKIYVNSKEQMLFVYRQSFKYLSMLGLPVGAGICVLAPRIIMLVSGESYLDATPALQVLACAMVFMFVNGLMGYTLITVDAQKIFMKIVGAGAFMNVVLNMFLIPRYGIAGAAFSTVVAEANANIACWIVLGRKYGISASLVDVLRSAICCCVMAVFVMFVDAYLPLPLVIVSGVLVYFALLFISKGIGQSELVLVKRLLRGKND